jgi:predicted acylesterase/phospholipase RssA
MKKVPPPSMLMLAEEAAFLACAGGGPEGDRMAGAMAALHQLRVMLSGGRDFDGYSGASIGACLAALMAAGIPVDKILDYFVEYLQKNRMLDFSPKAWRKLQLLAWDKIRELSQKALGSKARMGDFGVDLVICVSDLDTSEPIYISSMEHPRVFVHEVLPVSCAVHPRFTGAHAIPSMGTQMSPSRKRGIDGGWTDNTVDGVWDARGPRAAVRLNNAHLDRVRSLEQGGGLIDDDIATFKCALYAASLPKTKRSDGYDILLERGAGWDFSKSEKQVRDSWKYGFDAVMDQFNAEVETEAS